jgi:hypothetical protein
MVNNFAVSLRGGQGPVHRDAELGGVIGFWRAFGLGLGISFIAGVPVSLSSAASERIPATPGVLSGSRRSKANSALG